MRPTFLNFFEINFSLLSQNIAFSDTNFSFQKYFANIRYSG